MDAQVRARVVSNVDDETFEAFRDTVRRYVRERLVPLEMTVEADDEVPAAMVPTSPGVVFVCWKSECEA